MRKEIKTELTKEKILAAALDEFGTNGYAGASINNICNVGIAKGLLYHNFAGKNEIYLACLKRSFGCMLEYLKSSGIGADLQEYAKVRLTFFNEHPQEARLVFEAILQPPEVLKQDIAVLRKDFDDFNDALLEKVLKTVILQSNVTVEDAVKYCKLVQEMFNGYFSSPAARGLSFADTAAVHEAYLSKMLDYMLYGIAKRGEEE